MVGPLEVRTRVRASISVRSGQAVLQAGHVHLLGSGDASRNGWGERGETHEEEALRHQEPGAVEVRAAKPRVSTARGEWTLVSTRPEAEPSSPNGPLR